MAIPDFESMMLPLLKLAEDGLEHSINEASDRLSKHFQLTDEEKTQLKPSGGETTFLNRLRWARTFLNRAGLIVDPKKAHFKITSRGSEVLKQNLKSIDSKFLRQYPEFVEWDKRGRKNDLEDIIKEFDKNRNFSKTKPEYISEGEKEQITFIKKFPPEKILEIKIDDYVLGKVPTDRNTFSYMVEFGTSHFGLVGGGSAEKHIVYVNKSTKEYDYNHKAYGSSQEAFQAVIKGIDEILKAARQSVLDGDWNNLSKQVEGRKYFFSIPILSKIIALYFPNNFLRIWSDNWINYTLDRFGIARDKLAEKGDFYMKQGLLFKFKNSHPILKEWSNSFFSAFIASLKEEGEDFEDTEETNVEPMIPTEISPEFKKYEEILEKKKQIIFYGPPGTGKTYTAKLFSEEFTRSNTCKRNGDEPKSSEKNDWIAYFKTKLQEIVPSGYEVDVSQGEEYFALKSQNDEKRIRVFYGNKEKSQDAVEVGFKEKPLSWLEGVQQEDRFFIIVNLSNSIYAVLPYSVVKENALFRGGDHWDRTGDNSMWFTMSSLREDAAFLNSRNSEDGNRYDCRKFLFNLGRIFISDVEHVTFHPSYSYEEFIEGIRVRAAANSQLEYYIEEGIFKRICRHARNDRNKDNHYVLMIDEINRGNISKIFGELITLIEEDKREAMSASLSYSKQKFSVPSNVFIIGTMNTADRSLIQIDTALRRRFGFCELMPKPELLTQKVDGISLKVLLEKLNERIVKEGLREKQIGHSFFMKVNNISELQFVFANEIVPLLQDYFFDDYKKLAEDILSGDFVDSELMVIKDDWKKDPQIFQNAIKSTFEL